MSKTETGERISRGQSITLTFDATPENVSWLKAWSDAVPTLHFLDICVASLTKPGSTAAVRDPRKAALLARLRELDRPYNSFSYLLAGRKGERHPSRPFGRRVGGADPR